MNSIGIGSYSAGAFFFFLLTLVLVTGWRGRAQGTLLIAATAATALWSASLAVHPTYAIPREPLAQALSSLRYLTWFWFLLYLLRRMQAGTRLRTVSVLVYALLVFITLTPALHGLFRAGGLTAALYTKTVLAGEVLLSVSGLWLVELLFRNTPPEHRWAIKFLCLGIGGLFAYDFYLYSDALLFSHIDPQLWAARGAVDALAVPLIAVSAARNPEWSLDVFVSRGVVYHSATLLGAGAYLLVMAAMGYYIKVFGGAWGPLIQIVFFVGAGILLIALLFSGQFRARTKVFLSKHFFNYRYDYREEWLRFTNTLSSCKAHADPRECVIRAIAAIVESPGGLLWMRRASGSMAPTTGWNLALPENAVEPADASLMAFLRQRGWVVNLDEYQSNPELYAGLDLPDWIGGLSAAWVVVPLIDQNQLCGFIVLTQPRADVSFNWEVRDLLKTAGCQAASHLAQLETLEALAEARQFEGFNRLSALLLHDLKNLIAQQSLVVSSASRHKHNPAFIDDAVRIMAHSVERMNRLMGLLRTGLADARSQPTELGGLLEEAVTERSRVEPVPTFHGLSAPIHVMANRDRLLTAAQNLIQNAQEATPKDGTVRVTLTRHGARAMITIEDTGAGMDPAFVRNRLFRPFDTTKGDTGMGIGAYESREYVHELGGDLTVISAPGKGTRFRIELPCLSDVAETESGNYTEGIG
ncbi:MAG: hypothetical protein B7Z66_08150 [Chromatiales bacterium 21-64-14]|nr:MAG: hypothetical protein B7Z66_08150 [Chromatiales bacterium 21-64-14]HQU15308.1 PEP-CTERM system histidine kinase PrsK [Gammaproteobacteria bacterium]